MSVSVRVGVGMCGCVCVRVWVGGCVCVRVGVGWWEGVSYPLCSLGISTNTLQRKNKSESKTTLA